MNTSQCRNPRNGTSQMSEWEMNELSAICAENKFPRSQMNGTFRAGCIIYEVLWECWVSREMMMKNICITSCRTGVSCWTWICATSEYTDWSAEEVPGLETRATACGWINNLGVYLQSVDVWRELLPCVVKSCQMSLIRSIQARCMSLNVWTSHFSSIWLDP